MEGTTRPSFHRVDVACFRLQYLECYEGNKEKQQQILETTRRGAAVGVGLIEKSQSKKKEREEAGREGRSRHKVVAACSVRPYRSSRSKVKQVFFVEYENT